MRVSKKTKMLKRLILSSGWRGLKPIFKCSNANSNSLTRLIRLLRMIKTETEVLKISRSMTMQMKNSRCKQLTSKSSS